MYGTVSYYGFQVLLAVKALWAVAVLGAERVASHAQRLLITF